MSVTLHTTLGDLKLELFVSTTPKTCENFLALAAAGVYDDTIFHRNLKGFMIQGGDPTNTGRGGTSIWGGKFNDEIRSSLKVRTAATGRRKIKTKMASTCGYWAGEGSFFPS